VEVEEHSGRDSASAAGARRARVLRGAESFIVIGSRSERWLHYN